VTKLELAEYFAAVAPRMLPHLAGRPLSLVRCPEGSEGDCFFQKHALPAVPKEIGRVSITEKSRAAKTYLTVESTAGLVACAQIGALELHIWGCHKDKIERPDRVVFDLDPAEDRAFKDVKAAALNLAQVLREGGLESFPMLTGGKGIHIVVPIDRRHEWPVVSAFAKAFAGRIVDVDSERFTAAMSKAKRRGRIFIDHFRNGRGATAICPYSPRARDGAPVATPVSWQDLKSIACANAFSLADVLKMKKNPWPGASGLRQSLSAARLRRIGIELPG